MAWRWLLWYLRITEEVKCIGHFNALLLYLAQIIWNAVEVTQREGRRYWYVLLIFCILIIKTTRCTYLTHSTVHSSSWEAKWFADSQEIPRISRNPKVHYRTHKRTSPVSILGQPNPVHIPTSHLLQIHPNIIHPSIKCILTYLLTNKEIYAMTQIPV